MANPSHLLLLLLLLVLDVLKFFPRLFPLLKGERTHLRVSLVLQHGLEWRAKLRNWGMLD